MAVLRTDTFEDGKSSANQSLVPMLLVTATTLTAANQMITGHFWDTLVVRIERREWSTTLQGGVNIAGTMFLLGCLAVILSESVFRVIAARTQKSGVTWALMRRGQSFAAPGQAGCCDRLWGIGLQPARTS